MAETLLQKAQRLGIHPAGQPKETLLQKAQRLGIKPANAPKPTAPTLTSGAIGSAPVIKQLTQFGTGLGTEIAKGGLSLGQTFLKGADIISRGLGIGSQYKPLIENIEKIKQEVYTKPFQTELESGFGKAGEFTGVASQYIAPSSLITKGQKAITGAVEAIPATTRLAQFGRGALGVGARAGVEALGTGTTGLAISGGDTERAKQDALLGGAFSAGFGTLGALARGARDVGLSKAVLSRTSGIPGGAFESAENGVNLKATPEVALENTRKAATNLRAKNTAMWQAELPKIADEYKGVSKGLTEKQIIKLAKIADDFGIDETLVPQNLKNMSALESLNLMKGLNELDSVAVRISPKGAIVRQLRKELRNSILDAFGGEQGKVGQLWKNYAIKSEIFDNANDIVRAYKTNPISTVTAKNRLMAIFDENKPEFLKAIKELEKEMGVNLTRDIASTKFQTIFPKGVLKADGGLPTRAGVVDKFINALLLPFTSPRLVGKFALPSIEEASIIGKRLFGDYRDAKNSIPPTIQTRAINPSTDNMIASNIPKSISRNNKKVK
mgnify:CR=1 FL=1